jgi:uncharacterized protein YkwD
MARRFLRRILRLERLEQRELLSGATTGTTADQQYMLELMNEARTNPQAAAVRSTTNLDPDILDTLNYYSIDLNQAKSEIGGSAPQQPLAWNDQLAQAAQYQSQDQANTGVQSHTSSNGMDMNARLDMFGYKNRINAGEDAYAYSTSVDEAMKAFMLDWGVPDKGHRRNILQPGVSGDNSYADVGVGIVKTDKIGIGPQVVTVDFGRQSNTQPELLGVVYNDSNGDRFYEPGEGQGGVTIDATNLATGQTTSVQDWSSGGYQIPLVPGSYNVTAREGSQVIRSQSVNISNQNVKLDFITSDPWAGTQTPPAAPPAPPASPPPAPNVVNQPTWTTAASLFQNQPTPTSQPATPSTPAAPTPATVNNPPSNPNPTPPVTTNSTPAPPQTPPATPPQVEPQTVASTPPSQPVTPPSPPAGSAVTFDYASDLSWSSWQATSNGS